MFIRAKLIVKNFENDLYKVFTIENVGVSGLTIPLEKYAEHYELLQIDFESYEENDYEAPVE